MRHPSVALDTAALLGFDGRSFFLFVCAVSALTAGIVGVDGYSLPLSSNPTNVKNQWDPPGLFGSVTIPGSSVHGSSGSVGGDRSEFYSPLRPVQTTEDRYNYGRDDEDHSYGYTGYEPPAFSGTRGGFVALAASSPSPLSTGRIWRSNSGLLLDGAKYANSFRKAAFIDRRRQIGGPSPSRPWVTPALSMANYMQNGGPGNRNNRNNNNNNRNNNSGSPNNYNNNNSNRDYYDYDDRSRRRDPYDNDNDRYPPSGGGAGGPRGTNRFNTVGGVGSVNGANLSRGGRSMQFQNRRESNMAGRSGRMMDDAFSQFSADSISKFESRSPNDNYSRGGYRQDPQTGHWTDPNNNFSGGGSTSHLNNNRDNNNYGTNRNTNNGNNGFRPTYSTDNRYATVPPPSSSSSFTPIPPGDYSSAPEVRGPYGYDRGRGGAGGNVPYDNAYYNNKNHYNNNDYNGNRDYYDYDHDPDNGQSDFYSRNGNVVDNRRRSGSRNNAGGPGVEQNNYYGGDYRDSNRRMDRGGGLMRYRPNNQRGDGGYYGNGNDYEVGGYDEYYDSSGSFYNSEGKRVRRFDPYSDSSEGYYNPDHLSNDSTDPDRMVQNQRRRDGRDVQNGAHLRRYDPDYDGRQGLFDEASLYGSDVKSSRSYSTGYGDSMDHRVVGSTHGRRRVDTEDPSVLGAGWGETGGRDRFPMSSTSRFGDYREGDYAEDGLDRGRSRYNINNDRRGREDRRYDSSGSMRDNQRYNEDDYEDDYDRRQGNGSPRRGLGRRDVDNERDYYRAGDYSGPDLRGDDSMERFRQGKDVKKSDLYGFETANTPSSKKRIGRRKGGGDRRRQDRPRDGRGDPRGSTVNGSYNNNNSHRRDSTVNGSYNRGPPRDNGGRRRDGGGRINGSAGRDRGLSLDDLNEML